MSWTIQKDVCIPFEHCSVDTADTGDEVVAICPTLIPAVSVTTAAAAAHKALIITVRYAEVSRPYYKLPMQASNETPEYHSSRRCQQLFHNGCFRHELRFLLLLIYQFYLKMTSREMTSPEMSSWGRVQPIFPIQPPHQSQYSLLIQKPDFPPEMS